MGRNKLCTAAKKKNEKDDILFLNWSLHFFFFSRLPIRSHTTMHRSLIFIETVASI